MKRYKVIWYNGAGAVITRDIEAADLPAAKHKAFQMLCDNSGDTLTDDVEIYEHRYTFHCKGEANPKPTGSCSEFAKRDYFTGMKIRRGGKDNG